MEVEDLLKRAWGAVRDAGVPSELHELAFREAVAYLVASKNGDPVVEPAVTAKKSTVAASQPSATTSRSTNSEFAKFASEVGISEEDLELVFYFENDKPHLIGPKLKLGKNAADQARAVALAMTAAYHYGLDMNEVSSEIVRAECDRLKCPLGGNWSKVMGALTTVNYVGSSANKQYKPKSVTVSALQDLVKSIVGAPGE